MQSVLGRAGGTGAKVTRLLWRAVAIHSLSP